MTPSRPMSRIRQRVKARFHLWAGLFLISFLICCGQTAETGSPQSGKTETQSQVKGVGQSTMSQPEGQRFPYTPDEVLVKFKPETDATTIARIQSELKLETIQKLSSPNLFLMKITDGASVETTIKRLTNYKDVKYAEPNYGVKTTQ
jgi:hypothetical protein